MQKNISKPRRRRPNPQHNQHLLTPMKTRNHRKNISVIVVSTLIIGLLGAGISFFLAGNDNTSLIIGAIVGGAIGFLFGTQIVKGLSREKV